jgi:hypothetical protein
MKSLCLPISLFLFFVSTAQVGIGTNSVDQSAMLQLNSTAKGFIPPRMNSTQRNAIVSPADGLLVFDNSTDSYWYSNAGKWIELAPLNNVAYKIPADRINPNGAAGDRFGSAVCLGSTGTFGLVGAPGDNSGAGAMFRLSASSNNLWNLTTQNPAGLVAGDAFGYSVAVDRFNNSTDAVASAPFDDSSTVAGMGCAFFFENNVLVNKVYAPLSSRVTNARFGRSVDVAGSSNLGNAYAIIGAPGANAGKGAAFIYQYNPNTSLWEHDATFTDTDGSNADSFGVSVSIFYTNAGDSAWAFVGAPYDDDGANPDVGSVTAYRKAAGSNSWVKAGKFFPAAQTDDIRFGYSIANIMQCKKIIIGAPGKSSGQGIIYQADLTILNGGTGTFALTSIPSSSLSAGNGALGLGSMVSVMENGSSCGDFYMVSGSVSGLVGSNTAANFGTARLFRFRNSAWSVVEQYITDPYLEVTGYGFGQAVSISTDIRTMLIGAPLQKVDGNVQQGKVQFVKF